MWLRRAKAVGVYGREGNRSVPTLVNRAYSRAFFWDGRTSTLEEQVVKPIESETEMDMTVPEVVERLNRKRRYRKMFRETFVRGETGTASVKWGNRGKPGQPQLINTMGRRPLSRPALRTAGNITFSAGPGRQPRLVAASSVPGRRSASPRGRAGSGAGQEIGRANG